MHKTIIIRLISTHKTMGIAANQTQPFTGFFRILKDLFLNCNYFSYILLKLNKIFIT